MIQEMKYYTIICDGCGKDLNEDCEFSCWDTVEYNEDCAREDNWEIIDEKHYCPDCLIWDKEGENRIPKNKKETLEESKSNFINHCAIKPKDK